MEAETSHEQVSFMRMFGQFFWELLKAFLIAMMIIIPIRYFLVQPFFVRGASMEPSFNDGEYLIVDQLSYRFRDPQRGEVIVFRYPVDPTQFFIKRIIGLPGDTVEVEGGRVAIYNQEYPQGVVIDESTYLPDDLRTGGQVRTTLDDDEYFVLGDNRVASSDSRSWGLLDEQAIVGRIWIRAFPVARAHVFSTDTVGFISL